MAAPVVSPLQGRERVKRGWREGWLRTRAQRRTRNNYRGSGKSASSTRLAGGVVDCASASVLACSDDRRCRCSHRAGHMAVAAETSLPRTSPLAPAALRAADDAPSPPPADAPITGREDAGADARADAAASAADALQRRTRWTRARSIAGATGGGNRVKPRRSRPGANQSGRSGVGAGRGTLRKAIRGLGGSNDCEHHACMFKARSPWPMAASDERAPRAPQRHQSATWPRAAPTWRPQTLAVQRPSAGKRRGRQEARYLWVNESSLSVKVARLKLRRVTPPARARLLRLTPRAAAQARKLASRLTHEPTAKRAASGVFQLLQIVVSEALSWLPLPALQPPPLARSGVDATAVSRPLAVRGSDRARSAENALLPRGR